MVPNLEGLSKCASVLWKFMAHSLESARNTKKKTWGRALLEAPRKKWFQWEPYAWISSKCVPYKNQLWQTAWDHRGQCQGQDWLTNCPAKNLQEKTRKNDARESGWLCCEAKTVCRICIYPKEKEELVILAVSVLLALWTCQWMNEWSRRSAHHMFILNKNWRREEGDRTWSTETIWQLLRTKIDGAKARNKSNATKFVPVYEQIS